jgi:hypothetical protein
MLLPLLWGNTPLRIQPVDPPLYVGHNFVFASLPNEFIFDGIYGGPDRAKDEGVISPSGT